MVQEADMRHETRQTRVQRDLLKIMVDSRNKAELMRTMAESAEGEAQELYQKLAEAFSLSARLIEELKRAQDSQDVS
jgi:hypothetical protein